MRELEHGTPKDTASALRQLCGDLEDASVWHEEVMPLRYRLEPIANDVDAIVGDLVDARQEITRLEAACDAAGALADENIAALHGARALLREASEWVGGFDVALAGRIAAYLGEEAPG